ncbi:hypothetical protein [Halocatena halophila]|uniref:hypothetical protein n=1 Tax=Halocatena halophila TaxID=2814576 RepID=UPI002ED1B141
MMRMNAVGRWKREQSEKARNGSDDEPQKPEDWSQEEWDAVPNSMKADIASGNGYMSKEAVQRHLEAQKRG